MRIHVKEFNFISLSRQVGQKNGRKSLPSSHNRGGDRASFADIWDTLLRESFSLRDI